MYMYGNTKSVFTTESLDGYLPNLVGIKYLSSRTFVLTFGPNPPRCGSRLGPKYVTGVPFSKELLLQTGRLHKQNECILIAIIQKHLRRSVVIFGFIRKSNF